ncbi:hypothetical protein [Tistrella mobilis]
MTPLLRRIMTGQVPLADIVRTNRLDIGTRQWLYESLHPGQSGMS